ncbi:MAG: hypothetical protein LDL41_09510, partial [Coleofasciculus sp. S288]|nr:hypothetical protein [Coleofasciculus sp. S288]
VFLMNGEAFIKNIEAVLINARVFLMNGEAFIKNIEAVLINARVFFMNGEAFIKNIKAVLINARVFLMNGEAFIKNVEYDEPATSLNSGRIVRLTQISSCSSSGVIRLYLGGGSVEEE